MHGAYLVKGYLNMIVLLTIILFLNCGPIPKVPTVMEQPDCLTSLEGYYYCKDKWTGPTPVLILKETREITRSTRKTTQRDVYKSIKGKIISTDENGVTFASKQDERSSEFTSNYYPFSEIETLIDEDGRIVYGSIPMKYSQGLSLELWLEFDMAYSSGAKPLKIVMEPNKCFSYCVPWGTYKVTKIMIKDNHNAVGMGDKYPDLFIKIDEGKANYIGHLFISMQKDEVPDSLYVPVGFTITYKTLSSGSSSAGFWGGVLGGAAGGAIVAASTIESISGEREMLVGIDKKYKPVCKSPLKQNIITVKKKN
jgi:hypothetical protein